MFAGTNRPEAVFVANDHMAFAAMDVLRFELGLRVPDDVSVIGFDDVPPAAWPAYDLTTVRQAGVRDGRGNREHADREHREPRHTTPQRVPSRAADSPHVGTHAERNALLKGFDSKYRDFPDYILGVTREVWEGRGVGTLRSFYAPDIVVRSPASVGGRQRAGHRRHHGDAGGVSRP